MRGAALRWLPLGFLAVAAIVSIVLLDRPEPRYIEYPCQFDMIYNQSGPVDLVLAGTSRTMRGFDAEGLAKLLDPAKPPVVYDLSRGGRGMDQIYVQIRDLLEHRPVKRLLIEYNKPEEGEVGRWFAPMHWTFQTQATFSDIAASVASEPHVSLIERTRLALWLVSQKAAFLFEQIPTGRESLPRMRAPEPARSSDCTPTVKDINSEEVHIMADRTRARWAASQVRTWPIEDVPDERYDYYARKLVALARAHGTEIGFIFLTGIHQRAIAPDFKTRLEAHLGAPVFQLSPETLSRLYPGGYTDASHLSETGRSILMHAVADALRAS